MKINLKKKTKLKKKAKKGREEKLNRNNEKRRHGKTNASDQKNYIIFYPIFLKIGVVFKKLNRIN
jgi:hypothetical protein